MIREAEYKKLISKAKVLVDPEVDELANMANFSALLMETFSFHWVGFYRVLDKRLVLGPFQGPVACTSIGYNKGVCGTAWASQKAQIVGDVNQFPGHIACSPLTRSEIVIPCVKNGAVWGVLDIDSIHLNNFSELDKINLEKLTSLL